MTKTQEIERARTWRRELHQIPELGMDLPETRQYLIEKLEPLDCTLSFPVESGIAAFFDAGKETTIAFRADMDALPVDEQSGCAFESRHPGRMHACGHDGHMTNLLLFAYRLNDYFRTLDHNVLLIFQPGEENPGGALPICESGLLKEKNVRAIFGLHLWPLMEKGAVGSRKGGMMARSSEIDVDIIGKSVHTARYKEGIDALEIGCEFIREAYEMEQAIDPSVFRVMRFGKMTAGSVRNAVAGSCRIEGTMRAFEDENYDRLRNGLEKITRNLADKTGAEISIHFSNGYPAVLNDSDLFDQVSDELENLQILDHPEMISEDFAWYQKSVPGVFFFLGTGTGIELHDPRFDFEEDLLIQGADLFESLSKMHFE